MCKPSYHRLATCGWSPSILVTWTKSSCQVPTFCRTEVSGKWHGYTRTRQRLLQSASKLCPTKGVLSLVFHHLLAGYMSVQYPTLASSRDRPESRHRSAIASPELLQNPTPPQRLPDHRQGDIRCSRVENRAREPCVHGAVPSGFTDSPGSSKADRRRSRPDWNIKNVLYGP